MSRATSATTAGTRRSRRRSSVALAPGVLQSRGQQKLPLPPRENERGRHRGRERVAHPSNDLASRAAHLEVPNPERYPSDSPQLGIHAPIASNIARDLEVPVLAGTPGPVPGRMTVPERAVHEHGDPQSRPRQVRPSGRAAIVAAPAAHPRAIQSTPKLHLRGSVAVAHRRHDPPAIRRGPRVGHTSIVPDRTGVRGHRYRRQNP